MIDLNKYAEFVLAVTSDQSKKMEPFYDSMMDVHMRANAPLLLTAMIGLTSEAGEAQEIVKKCLFRVSRLLQIQNSISRRNLVILFGIGQMRVMLSVLIPMK